MSKFTVIALLALAAIALGGSATAYAQSRALERSLATAARLDCRFSTIATGTWDNAAASVAVAKSDFEASFFDIDVDGGTAEADGAFGASFIVVRYSHGYLHFMQMLDSGPLRVTTVLARETAGGRLMAIHTRHEYSPTVIPGFTSRPEMYIGDCAVS